MICPYCKSGYTPESGDPCCDQARIAWRQYESERSLLELIRHHWCLDADAGRRVLDRMKAAGYPDQMVDAIKIGEEVLAEEIEAAIK